MKSRILFAALALALFCTTAAWSQSQEVKKEEKKAMEHGTTGKTEMGTLKSFACPDPCNFEICSRDEKELTAAGIAHVKKHHNMTISEKDVMSKAVVVTPKAEKK